MAVNPYKRYLNTKRATSKSRGIGFDLTLDDLYALLERAQIDIDNVGKKKGQYVLGRLKDEGPYTRENCRFILTEENHSERKYSPRPRRPRSLVSLETRKKMSESHKKDWANNPERRKKLILSNSVNPRRKSKS